MRTSIISVLTTVPLTLAVISGTPALAGKDPFNSQFENYQCYKVLRSDFNYDKERRVDVADQFGKYRQYAAKLVMICNPVDINGEGIKNPKVHLACFTTDPANNGGLKEQTVFVQNRFGEGKVELEKVSQLLCVTSVKEH